MRRTTLVATAGDPAGERGLREVFTWLRGLPIGSLHRAPAVRSRWSSTRGTGSGSAGRSLPSYALADWLRGGDRVLATWDAAAFLTALGLEPDRNRRLPSPSPTHRPTPAGTLAFIELAERLLARTGEATTGS